MLRPLHLARRLGVLVLPLALAGGALPAAAAGFLQTAQADAPQAGSQGAAYSQEQLESYAAAFMKVQEIDRAWQPKIQQAEDQQQADQMATEATDEVRSEEHTSELQSLMRISYDVFCLKKKTNSNKETN